MKSQVLQPQPYVPPDNWTRCRRRSGRSRPAHHSLILRCKKRVHLESLEGRSPAPNPSLSSQARAVFEGTIKAITFATLSRSTTESVIERRVTATVDLKLTDKDGDVIWSVKDFTSYEEYTVSEDKITDESNKREAVDKIATRSAEKLISRMMTNF